MKEIMDKYPILTAKHVRIENELLRYSQKTDDDENDNGVYDTPKNFEILLSFLEEQLKESEENLKDDVYQIQKIWNGQENLKIPVNKQDVIRRLEKYAVNQYMTHIKNMYEFIKVKTYEDFENTYSFETWIIGIQQKYTEIINKLEKIIERI